MYWRFQTTLESRLPSLISEFKRLADLLVSSLKKDQPRRYTLAERY